MDAKMLGAYLALNHLPDWSLRTWKAYRRPEGAWGCWDGCQDGDTCGVKHKSAVGARLHAARLTGNERKNLAMVQGAWRRAHRPSLRAATTAVLDAAENLYDAVGSPVNPSPEYMGREQQLRSAVEMLREAKR